MKSANRKPGSSKRGARKPSPDFIAVRRSQLIGAAVLASSGLIALAATVPHTFTSGTPAVAADVNANFQALTTALTTAQADIAVLQAKLASVSIVTANGQPTVRFTGVNVQVVNGLDSTGTANGTGNLIVGYDEADTSNTNRCTIGTDPITWAPVTDSVSCSAAGGTMTTAGFKSGSHYIISGSENNYSRWGGVVAGFQNTSNFDFANVTGGTNNTASGLYASVSGGRRNTAVRTAASVAGGSSNTASGAYASVTGGSHGAASGSYATVSGGSSNTASGPYASVTGGGDNVATNAYATVTGGQYNTASGHAASVTGGGNGSFPGGNTADTAYSAILGGIGQNTSSDSQTVPVLP